jgi:hypothetical protein
MKNKLTGFLFLAIVAFTVTGCNKEKLIYTEVKKASDEINKQCPLTIDADTRLDSTNATDNPVGLVYNYTVVSKEKKEIEAQLTAVKKMVKKQTEDNISKTTELKFYKDNKIPLTYSYKDKNGVFLFDFTITP